MQATSLRKWVVGSGSRARWVRRSRAYASLSILVIAATLLGPSGSAQATVIPQRLECLNFPGVTQLNYCSTNTSREAAALQAGAYFCDHVIGDLGFVACTFSNWVPVDDLTGRGTLHSCGPNLVCLDQPQATLGGGPPSDTCNVATSTSGLCGATVAALKSIVKSTSDPTRTFHMTQTCIAEQSCALRCTMDNCDWLKNVVPDFVNPYLTKTGNWPKVESDCASFGFGTYGALWCARNMAMNHIYNDLIPALSKTGCGSDSDWNKIFEVIKTCTAGNLPGGAPLGSSQVAALAVYRYRQDARSACTASRSSAGLPIDINPSSQGLVCTP